MHEVFDVCRYVPVDMTFQQWQSTVSYSSLIFDFVSALTATASPCLLHQSGLIGTHCTATMASKQCVIQCVILYVLYIVQIDLMLDKI